MAYGPAESGHRPSEVYVAPIPGPRGQMPVMFGTEYPRALMKHVSKLRALIEEWREDGYPDAIDVLSDLLFYWQDPERETRLYFAQFDAIRTLIYLTEIAPAAIRERLADINAEYNDGIESGD